ncbi:MULTISPECIES: cobalamin biosynthesis protein [Rhodopseudomonas]|uniref:Cobalamin biosynthesis protein CbiG n=1 Tax=Rhodopseudomonas palustris TaxID=1076 RepID=A0A0D7E2P7_RHOPL|nr:MULTISPECIES: cobalamin biosynthesis protein [Rhodopseudomonas]KIZ33877.1 cobalamin biosynthesis protein CbiG [Rhodopseudomonas palustris]MDF3814486.1 cobalamin biosynthesis protein [Rhodopseudomonas sp. BAL398]WOK18852.1 cobalamin biosynthesis protein [Rhodopseudomonas sp. BAL398]
MSRLIIGLGFRDQASAQAIGEALHAAIAQTGGTVTAIAVPADKAAHAGLRAVASAANLPIEPVTAAAMQSAAADGATRSPTIQRHRGVGSVCEAAALAAAGAGARLVVARLVSEDRTATAAAAINEDLS